MNVIAVVSEDERSLALGNVKAFDSLYERYRNVVYANILKIVKIPGHAEDILQDVFVSFWQNRHKFDASQSAAGWLFVVSYNKAVTFLRERVRHSIDYIGDYRPFEHVVSDDGTDETVYSTQIAMMEEAVGALPTRKREVFKLCRFEGKSKEEVASLMGISPASVKDYLTQSNKTIKDYISTHYPYGTVGLLLLMFVTL